MARRKQANRTQKRRVGKRRQNKGVFRALLGWLIRPRAVFAKDRFHGNTKWAPEELAQQAIIWAWQDTRNVTDAFETMLEACNELNIKDGARTYTGFVDALVRYREIFSRRLRMQFQALAEEVAGRFWRDRDWLLMGFDGSRATTPRTASNEKEFCGSNYGSGKTAKYRKKKSKGMRRCKNKKNKPQP
jgi:hypothetical protein